MTKIAKIIKLLLTLSLGLAIVACDSNRIAAGGGGDGTSATDPSLTAPNNDVAVNVGPVEQLVATDVLTQANTIRDNTIDDVNTITGGYTSSGGYLVSSHYEAGTTSTGTFSINDTQDCTDGGHKTISGSYTMEYNSSEVTGTVVGTYTITYAGCLDAQLMETSDGTCVSTPSVDGEVVTTVSSTFSLTSYEQEQAINDEMEVASQTNSDLSVSVGSTATTQGYTFDYTLLSNTTDTGLSGTVSYADDLYSFSELEDYVAASTESVVCP